MPSREQIIALHRIAQGRASKIPRRTLDGLRRMGLAHYDGSKVPKIKETDYSAQWTLTEAGQKAIAP